MFEHLREVDRGLDENYKVGRRFEYRVMTLLRKHGWHVMRRFGSHAENTEFGKVSTDLTAYRFGVYMIISCKYRSKKPSVPLDDEYYRNLVKYAKCFGALPVFSGVDEKGRVYFVNLNNMKRFEIEEFDEIRELESIMRKVRQLEVYKKTDGTTQIERLINEAWKTIELCNEEIERSERIGDPKGKARWANIKTMTIQALNRILWRAGQVETADDITALVEKAQKEMVNNNANKERRKNEDEETETG